MGLFGKKKLEEDPSYAEASEGRVRDLRPENRKFRKEPPKPWGKFERIVVLIALLFTVLTAVVLMLYSAGMRLPKFNVDLSKFNIFQKEIIIIR